jgi:hypothetical protein
MAFVAFAAARAESAARVSLPSTLDGRFSVYSTPEFALELQRSGMTRKQIADELCITVRQCERWLTMARKAEAVALVVVGGAAALRFAATRRSRTK